MENAILSNIRQDMSKIQLSGLGIPAIVLLIISMLILPLPSFLLDFLFANVVDADNKSVVDLLTTKNIVTIFQGRSENGPRALGNRSILFKKN